MHLVLIGNVEVPRHQRKVLQGAKTAWGGGKARASRISEMLEDEVVLVLLL
jgi:hypothetical protein